MDPDVAKQAMLQLYPSHSDANIAVEYSGHFKGYNANIQWKRIGLTDFITCKLSQEWRSVGNEIKSGLIQSMLLRLMKRRWKSDIGTTESKTELKTEFLQMYESFMKNVERFAPVTRSDPLLGASFDRVNALMFDGLMEKPNLVVGGMTFRQLGLYTYASDTITLSQVLIGNEQLVDYVMYHELLHKKHRYYQTQGGRRMHHHAAFRHDEQKYPGWQELEKELHAHLRKKRLSHSWMHW